MSGTADSTFTVVSLEPKEVPGAVLPYDINIEDCSNFILQRWSECRGLKKTGNKGELIQRVINCIDAGRENHIFLCVDGGKWYDAKRNLGNTNNECSSGTVPRTIQMSVSTAPLLWAKFPSRAIPKYLNKGHIYTYIAGLQYENDDHEVQHEGTTEKPFRRGSQFVSSDYIYEVYDAKVHNCYYLKAKCFSSFRKNVFYAVGVILNDMSGAVINGTCECRQSALGPV
ncbi:hypothetical protein FQR65_LT17785 [Abscondita terminalis]|nr:hypothetical protein FQR65_LT17785 [Abscondita terminalis]